MSARRTKTANPNRVGGPGPGAVRRPSDAERVLGQIERGEVRAGPDAARQIAARHQAAYGSVWGDADTAWADALNGLTGEEK